MTSVLETLFPGLRGSAYSITSARTPLYNCIAWAAQDTEQWWEPDPLNIGYWPAEVPRTVSIEAFVTAFATLGYERCENSEPEQSVEKIAFFVDTSGRPIHVARLLPSGRWTSKLGQSEDIEHDLHAISGELYGSVCCILSRATR